MPHLPHVSILGIYDAVQILNTHSGVGFRWIQTRIKPQERLEQLPFTLVRKLGVAFKRLNHAYRKHHNESHLI